MTRPAVMPLRSAYHPLNTGRDTSTQMRVGDRAHAFCLTGTWSGQIREQGVEENFLLDTNIVARHGVR